MVNLTDSPLEINLLSEVLQLADASASLTVEERNLLLHLGAVSLLGQTRSPEAVTILLSVISSHPNQSIKFAALQTISRLANDGDTAAIDALFILALELDIPSARQQIVASKLEPTNRNFFILLQGLSALESGNPIRNDELFSFTDALINSATESLQNRLIILAKSTRMRHWADLIDIIREKPAPEYSEISAIYAALTEQERSLTLHYLNEAAKTSIPAREAICHLFTTHEDRAAHDSAVEHGYAPEDLTQRALFFFLTEQWEQYSQTDASHTSLVNAYESGNRALRRRILAVSRQSGQIEWLREISRTADIRWLGDLTDADWDLSTDRLLQALRFEELWRLALSAPAIWSVRILVELSKANWTPSKPADLSIFVTLTQKALDCSRKKLELQPTKAFHALTGDLTCLAINDRANLLAAGSTGQAIYVWQLPEGDLQLPAFMGPATTTRSLAFSPDNEYIAAASGDQRIRIFRLSNSQIIKTIEGHRGLVRALVIHHGGRVMVSAGFDGTVRFWRFPHGTEIKVIQSTIREIFCLTLLHRGDIVASAGAGAEISLWKIPDGTLLRKLYSPSSGITHMSASRTSDLIAAVARDHSITVWNTTSGQIIRQWNNLSTTISGISFHSDDQVLLTAGSDGWITLWSIPTGRIITRLKDPTGQPLTALADSLDGEWLVSANSAGKLHLWNLSTFLWLRRPNQPGSRLSLSQIQDRLNQPSLSPAERPWLAFLIESLKWSQRFDIELADTITIPVGEFDIEL